MKFITFLDDETYLYEVDTSEQNVIIKDEYRGEYDELITLTFEEIVNLYNTIKDHYSKQPINL